MTNYLKYILVPIVVLVSAFAAIPMLFVIMFASDFVRLRIDFVDFQGEYIVCLIALIIYLILGIFTWNIKPKFMQFCGASSIVANAIGVYFFWEVMKSM